MKPLAGLDASEFRALRSFELAELDALLASAGAATLTQFRTVRVRAIFKILRARSVQSEEERRLLQTALSDMHSPLLSPEARAIGEAILTSDPLASGVE